MEISNTHGVSTLQSKLLSPHKNLIHGFTTKGLGFIKGDQINHQSVKDFLYGLQIHPDDVVWFEQTHGVRVVFIPKNNGSKTIKNADGGMTSTKGVILAIRTADCLPILLFDSKYQMVCAVHAGWRGLLGRILTRAILEMKKRGCKTRDIRIVIGPHIGACCYCVPIKRARVFEKAFGKDGRMTFLIGRQWYLDLGYTAYKEALKTGIAVKAIDIMINCTFCQEKQFHSFRREGKKLSGHLLSFIGLR